MQRLFGISTLEGIGAVAAYVEDVLDRERDSRDWITRPDVMIL
jgi:hypothetical protein